MQKITKNILLSLITFSLLASEAIPANAVPISARGAPSCGEWVKNRTEHNLYESVNITWLMGFLSGLAIGKDVNFLPDTDAKSLYLWIDNYCQANPLENVSLAGYLLSLELVKRTRR